MFPLPLLLASLLVFAAQLTARAHVTELPKLLQTGIPQQNLSGDGESRLLFRVILPAGARHLKFDTSGGAGDVDLFIRFGAYPTTEKYDQSSEGSTNKEHVHIARPAAGVWYVMLYAARIYRGMRLVGTYERAPDADAVPRVLPAPGAYAERVIVQGTTALRGGQVRYTTDGQDPTFDSPVYSSAMRFTEDVELRLQTFRGRTPRGPVLVAPFAITPRGTITALQNGAVLQHRGGLLGSETLYKITVPAGMQRLRVMTRNGTGALTAFLRRGAPPTRAVYDQRAVAVSNRADLTVLAPDAGEWFILLFGRANYSGLSVQASYRTSRADLVVWPGTLEPYQTTETFTSDDCEVQEDLITAGEHRLLRFSTESRNLGGADLRIGDPADDPDFEFFECHFHYHFRGFASYTLKSKDGAIVGTGRKVSFCLEDVARWDAEARPASRYSCENQGIQAGWSDIYNSGLPGQWIEINGVPAGEYDLEVTVNPDGLLDEADLTNNTAVVPVTIVD